MPMIAVCLRCFGRSREAQAAVSTALAEQVLGALHELLRGLDAAEPKLIRELARTRPGHLYEGLLTVLMRLVFHSLRGGSRSLAVTP